MLEVLRTYFIQQFQLKSKFLVAYVSKPEFSNISLRCDFVFSFIFLCFNSSAKYGLNEKSMQRNLLIIRSKALPKPPKSASEIITSFQDDSVMNNYGMTDRDDPLNRSPFYKHAFQCDDFQLCVFASDDVVNAIKENIEETRRIYLIDGTFKITPFGEFVQVVIISIVFMGQVNIKIMS